jgi:hypothetical protein
MSCGVESRFIGEAYRSPHGLVGGQKYEWLFARLGGATHHELPPGGNRSTGRGVVRQYEAVSINSDSTGNGPNSQIYCEGSTD